MAIIETGAEIRVFMSGILTRVPEVVKEGDFRVIWSG